MHVLKPEPANLPNAAVSLVPGINYIVKSCFGVVCFGKLYCFTSPKNLSYHRAYCWSVIPVIGIGDFFQNDISTMPCSLFFCCQVIIIGQQFR
jgi:hypothetical protein